MPSVIRLPGFRTLVLPAREGVRQLTAFALDVLWIALAVGGGLLLASWLCAKLGLPAPLTPIEPLLLF